MVNVLFTALVLSAPPPEVSVTSVHARGPEQYELRLRQRCGSERLEIRGFGPAAPENAVARIRVNGRPLRGEAADELRRDLSNRRAVYRVVAVCTRGRPGMWLILHSGESLVSGEVRFLSGRARIMNGVVIEYSGLEEITADGFWFR